MLTINRAFSIGLVGLVFCCLQANLSSAAAADIKGSGLKAIHQWTALRHRNVHHMSADKLVALQSETPGKLLILDVREKSEHAVSRIAGSIRIPPSIKASEFIQAFGDKLKNRTVVLYCSVGARSSRLAARIQKPGKAAGATAIFNLSGGVFNWHNQSRQLMDDDGKTDLVHPYSETWSKLLLRRKLASYKPKPPQDVKQAPASSGDKPKP